MIIENYVQHIVGIETATQEYSTKPMNQWNRYQWQGFFKKLEEEIEVESWDNVPNPNGGFWGLWWHSRECKSENTRMYLQFEEHKLCIKIEFCGEKSSRSEVREKYHAALIEEAEKMGLKLERPTRFGWGVYMTIGIIPSEEIFGRELIDIDAIIHSLHKYENLVDSCKCK